MEPGEYLGDDVFALAVYAAVCERLDAIGPYEVRASISQLAFRRRRGFAYLWLPGNYLAHPRHPVVLSIALGRHDRSPRFDEVAHPTPQHWMHHLGIDSPDDVDDEVADWLREAMLRAS